jgi:AIPR protein
MGTIAGQARDQIGKPPRIPEGAPSLLDRTTVEYLDEDRLTDELRNALSQTEGVSGDSELVTAGPRGEKTPILQIHGSNHPSYVLVVPAMQIVQLYKNKSARDSLFTLNIRNYIGNTTTNKRIVETARDQPQHFFHFNNGISCLARKVTVNEGNDRLKAVDLQVINGAQTVKALVRAAEGHQLHPEPYVLVRITEIQHGYGGESQFATEITRFNNTQNVIKISDFRSNDAVQKDLVAKFDYSRFGKPVQYIPKRTDKRKTNAIPIRLEEFSKVIYSFLYDPVRFSGQTSFLFDDGPQGGYRLIFGDSEEVWSKMPAEAFRLRSAIWWIADEFNRKLVADRSLTKTQIERASLERKWFIINAARLVLQRKYGEESYVGKLTPHYRGDWRLGEDSVGEMFASVYESAKRSVMYVYQQATQQPDFNHRNWMRNMKSVEAIEAFIRLAPSF